MGACSQTPLGAYAFDACKALCCAKTDFTSGAFTTMSATLQSYWKPWIREGIALCSRNQDKLVSHLADIHTLPYLLTYPLHSAEWCFQIFRFSTGFSINQKASGVTICFAFFGSDFGQSGAISFKPIAQRRNAKPLSFQRSSEIRDGLTSNSREEYKYS